MSGRGPDSARSMMHPMNRLDFSNRVAKRAQYEAFEFTVMSDGVLVRNCSHADPDNHEYRVTVENGTPVDCECPADRKYERACKHRVAVAIRPPIIDAVISRAVTVTSEEGTIMAESDVEHAETQTEEPGCPDCVGEFPCWECYRTGQKDFPEESTPES